MSYAPKHHIIRNLMTNASIYRHIGDNRRFDDCIHGLHVLTGEDKEALIRKFPYPRPNCSIS